MALNDLTLAVDQGVKGRPFRSKIEGLTAGTEVVASASFGSIGVLNGFLAHPSLPNGYMPASVAITERVPSTGETKTTRVEIEIHGHADVRARALELLPEDETLERYGSFPSPDEEGSDEWFVKAYDDDGERFVDTLVSDPGSGPEGSIAFADFKSGTYDYGSNMFDDFLYQNEDYGTWEGAVVPGTGFVPAEGQQNISVGQDLADSLIGTGMTLVANVILPDGTAFFASEMLDLPNWNQEVLAFTAADDGNTAGESFAGTFGVRTNGPPVAAGAVRIALSIWDGGARVSANGGDALFGELTDPFIGNAIGLWINGSTIEDLAFYAGAKTEAELEALSAS